MNEKPHINLITEFSKSTIGIVALLLGFSVTFLSTENSSDILAFAIWNWVAGICCVITSLLVLAKLVNLSRGKGSENSVVLFANIAFFLLFAHLISFVFLGYVRFSSSIDVVKSKEDVRQFMVCEEVVRAEGSFIGKHCKVDFKAKN